MSKIQSWTIVYKQCNKAARNCKCFSVCRLRIYFHRRHYLRHRLHCAPTNGPDVSELLGVVRSEREQAAEGTQ